MSKQNVSKSNPGVQSQNKTKGMPNQPAARSAGSIPPPPRSSAVSSKYAARTTGSRAAAPVKRKSGFRLRPLDIALLIAGALVVGFIVMSALQAPPQQIDSN